MTLVKNTLATQLQNLTPTSSENAAIALLANAYGTYAAGATANAVPITAAGVNLGKTAMRTALIGMSVPGAGLTKIPAGVVAFWAAVCGSFSVSWTGAIAATPPPHATLASGFPAVCTANTAPGVTLAQAADSIATLMHANAIVGGTVTFPGPVVAPIL